MQKKLETGNPEKDEYEFFQVFECDVLGMVSHDISSYYPGHRRLAYDLARYIPVLSNFVILSLRHS